MMYDEYDEEERRQIEEEIKRRQEMGLTGCPPEELVNNDMVKDSIKRDPSKSKVKTKIIVRNKNGKNLYSTTATPFEEKNKLKAFFDHVEVDGDTEDHLIYRCW